MDSEGFTYIDKLIIFIFRTLTLYLSLGTGALIFALMVILTTGCKGFVCYKQLSVSDIHKSSSLNFALWLR